MKIISTTIFILSLITSCQEKKGEPFNLNSFPKNWVRLSEKEGELVVYNSCNAGNLLLTISKIGKKNELLLHGQQENSEFSVLESQKIKDTIYIDAKLKDNNEKQVFKFIWINKHDGLGRWTTTYLNGFTSDNIFVVSKKQNNFKHVEQPCFECWGHECDEFKNDIEKINNPIDSIQKVFEDYIQYQESTDSQKNKDLMANSLKSINKITNPDELEILINVWMYYDPTDFPDILEIYRILKINKPQSIEAIKNRIKNKKEWETENSAPYSDLTSLKQELEKK